jgi:hypothetical protein
LFAYNTRAFLSYLCSSKAATMLLSFYISLSRGAKNQGPS